MLFKIITWSLIIGVPFALGYLSDCFNFSEQPTPTTTNNLNKEVFQKITLIPNYKFLAQLIIRQLCNYHGLSCTNFTQQLPLLLDSEQFIFLTALTGIYNLAPYQALNLVCALTDNGSFEFINSCTNPLSQVPRIVNSPTLFCPYFPRKMNMSLNSYLPLFLNDSTLSTFSALNPEAFLVDYCVKNFTVKTKCLGLKTDILTEGQNAGKYLIDHLL